MRTSLFVDRRGAKGRYFRVVPGDRRFEIAEGVIFSVLKREKFQSMSVLQRFGQRTSEFRATFEWQKQRLQTVASAARPMRGVMKLQNDCMTIPPFARVYCDETDED